MRKILKLLFTNLFFLVFPLGINAQTLQGFLSSADPITDSQLQVMAVVIGGSGQYKYLWNAESPGKVGSIIDGYINNYSLSELIELPLKFKLTCIVIDTIIRDTIILSKVITSRKQDELIVSYFEEHSEYQEKLFFSHKDYPFEVYARFENFKDLGYHLEVSGSAERFVSKTFPDEAEEGKEYFSFNATDTGSYLLVLTFKDSSGQIKSSQTLHITVFEGNKELVMVMDTILYKGMMPQVNVFTSINTVGGILIWTITDSSSNVKSMNQTKAPWITGSSMPILYRVGYYGIFSVKCKLILDDGREFEVEKKYSVLPPPVIEANEKEACAGDTVLISYVLKLSVNRIPYVEGYISFNPFAHEVLNLYTKNNEFVNVISSNGTIGFWSANKNFFYPGDTLLTVKLKIKDSLQTGIWSGLNNPSVELPFVKINSINNALFTTSKIEGLPTAVKLKPVTENQNLLHSWSYGQDQTNTVYNHSPVIGYKDISESPVCHQVNGRKGCINRSCDTIRILSSERLFSISGHIIDNNRSVVSGQVIAYLVKNENYYPAGKAFATTDGAFVLEDLEIGNYVLLGLPDDKKYNAAYYYGEGVRSRANLIPVTGNVTDVDLMIQLKPDSYGEEIKGSFLKDSLTLDYQFNFESVYGELPSVVFLTDSDGKIIDYSDLQKDNTFSMINHVSSSSVVANFGRLQDEVSIRYYTNQRKDKEPVVTQIFPNPTVDYIYIDLLATSIVKCFSITGQLVFEQVFEKGRNRADLTILSDGYYTIQITNEKGVYSFPISKINGSGF